MQKMPVLFIGHGSPLNAIEDNEFIKNDFNHWVNDENDNRRFKFEEFIKMKNKSIKYVEDNINHYDV